MIQCSKTLKIHLLETTHETSYQDKYANILSIVRPEKTNCLYWLEITHMTAFPVSEIPTQQGKCTNIPMYMETHIFVENLWSEIVSLAPRLRSPTTYINVPGNSSEPKVSYLYNTRVYMGTVSHRVAFQRLYRMHETRTCRTHIALSYNMLRHPGNSACGGQPRYLRITTIAGVEIILTPSA